MEKQRARLPVSAATSISDKAFLYLVLVNYWDNWEDQVNGKDTHDVRPPRYTKRRSSHVKHRGWSEEGTKKFNDLHHAVRIDRKQSKAAEVEEEY